MDVGWECTYWLHDYADEDEDGWSLEDVFLSLNFKYEGNCPFKYDIVIVDLDKLSWQIFTSFMTHNSVSVPCSSSSACQFTMSQHELNPFH